MPPSHPAGRRSRRFRLLLAGASVLVTIVLLEVGSAIALHYMRRSPPRPSPAVRSNLVLGRATCQTEPAPWLLYRARPNQSSKWATTNALGLRNAELDGTADPGAFRVLILGGSVAWGQTAASNEDTIATHLQAALERASTGRLKLGDRRIEVLNAGVVSYVAWQETLAYALQWRALRPDVVIAIHGFNEPYGAVLGGEPGVNARYAQVRTAYRDAAPSWWGLPGTIGRTLLASSNTLALVRSLNPPTLQELQPPPPAQVATAYGRAVTALLDLCRSDDATVMSVLQPTALVEAGKPLSDFEHRVVRHYDARTPGIHDYVVACYRAMIRARSDLATEHPAVNFLDATNVYANEEATIFVDSCHLTTRGRVLLAQRIARALVEQLARR